MSNIPQFIQFTVETNEENFSCLLSKIAESNVNIKGYCKKDTIAKFIPNFPGEEQGLDVIQRTRDILYSLNICFTEQVVVGAQNISGVPGQLAANLRLFSGRVKVKASYGIEDSIGVFEVNDIDLAKRLLLKHNCDNAPKDCPDQHYRKGCNCEHRYNKCDHKYDDKCHDKYDKYDKYNKKYSKKHDKCNDKCNDKCHDKCHDKCNDHKYNKKYSKKCEYPLPDCYKKSSKDGHHHKKYDGCPCNK